MRKLLLLLALLLAFGLGSAQTLVVGQSGLPVTLDTGQDGNSLTPAYQVLEPLVAFAQGSAEITEGLATSWEANEDATSWTFTLRDGVTFHDGTPFNAEAVKFNYDRWNFLDNEYNFVEEGKDFTSFTYIFGAYHGQDGYLLESVEAVDENTVTFNLTQPVGYFPNLVASSYFGMHSPQAVMAGGIEYGTPTVGVVGTGPFEFSEWIDGDRVVLTRYEDYWGEAAQVEQIVFRGIEEAATRLAELEAGTLDIALNLSPDDYEAVQNNADLEAVFAEADLRIGYIGMHQGNEPFDDPLVRQALAHAIDKEAVVEAFYGELGAVANEFIPPTLLGRIENDPYPYDPERARELLAEAGYPDGFDTEFWYMPVSRPYYPDPQAIAEAVASQLADVGINAELLTEDWGVYLEDYLQGKFPMYMLGWSADFADPDNFISPFFNQANAAGFGYENPELFDLIGQAQSAPSDEERASLYTQIGEILAADLPAIPLVNPRTLNAVRANIEGFYPSPLGSTVPFSSISKN